MSSIQPTILFSGGGTGGHIYPAIAIAEQLRKLNPDIGIHFACSDRKLDADILTRTPYTFTALSAKPLPSPKQFWKMVSFVRSYQSSKFVSGELIKDKNIKCVVAMGGFGSAPSVSAARKANIPSLLVNLDAIPGKANRFLASRVDHIYSVYPHNSLPTQKTTIVGLPLRAQAIGTLSKAESRTKLGLNPDKSTLLITGASQGAKSINELMKALASSDQFQAATSNWQILHLSGHDQAPELESTYKKHQLHAKVIPFLDEMGLAWTAADLALSRSGAGSVGEALANATPSIFLPYPYHRDQHQKHNAQPLVDAGGAILQQDLISPQQNRNVILPLILNFINNPDQLIKMSNALKDAYPGNGADLIAKSALEHF